MQMSEAAASCRAYLRLDDPKCAPPLESAIELPLNAASNNAKREDVEAATNQVTIVLRERGMTRQADFSAPRKRPRQETGAERVNC
jgi:hypothetical protein